VNNIRKKLPDDLESRAGFADSPLRPTTTSGAEDAPPAAPSPPPPPPGTPWRPHSATRPEAPAPPSSGALRGPERAPRAETTQPAPEQIKSTIYLSREQDDAVETEVYQRRLAGERGFGRTDFFRELVDAWRTARSSKS
jgi:hypothetical protein